MEGEYLFTFIKKKGWEQGLLSSKICAVLRPRIKKLTLIFCGSHPSLKEDVIAAGEEALIILYNGKVERSLDSLRYKRYCDKVASSSSYVHPQTLPPTSSAEKYHSLRVYYQIRQWQGTEAGMSPQDWDWKESDGALIPVTTDLDPDPNELLRIVRCNCQTDCSTLSCSCRKHGLNCSVACGNCRGSECRNSNPEMDLDDETEQLSV